MSAPVLFLILALGLASLIVVPLIPSRIKARKEQNKNQRALEGEVRADLAVLGTEVMELAEYAVSGSRAGTLYLSASQTFTRALELTTDGTLDPSQWAALYSDIANALRDMKEVRRLTA